MKTNLLLLFTVLTICLINNAHAGEEQVSSPFPSNANLTVSIQNLRSNQGRILALLFNRDAGFPGDQASAHRRGSALIQNKTAVITFQHLEAGEYALVLFHDENNDSILNKTWYGKPKEGVATSNNVESRFGPPKFEDCKFQFKANAQLSVKLRYYD